MSIKRQQLIDAFAPSLGLDRAAAFIDDAVNTLQFGVRAEYTAQEVVALCEHLKEHAHLAESVKAWFGIGRVSASPAIDGVF